MRNSAALIEFFYTEDTLYTFLVRGDAPLLNVQDAEPIVLSTKISSNAINEALNELTLHFKEDVVNSKNISELQDKLERLSLIHFFEIGQQIFTTALLDLITTSDILYLVPYGILHYFPLHACKIPSQEYLIDKFIVSYLPTASLLVHFKKEIASGINSVLLAGVDSTGFHNIFLHEIQQIEALPLWHKGSVKKLEKQECTRENVLAALVNKKLIHLSAHGHFNVTDPMASGISLFGEYSDKYIDGEGLAPEDYQLILSANDIYKAEKIDAELLVLSACISANNERKEGEELIGLSRSIFAAGVQSTILCLFPTVKEVTAHPQIRELRFARFYELWLMEGYPKAKAFQQFILGIKKQQNYAHPFFWCPFIFMGKID